MADDTSLLQEIDDALRADRAYAFWKRYGKVVIGGCVGIVVLTAASAFWKSHLREQQIQHTQIMLSAGALAANAQYAEAPKLLEASSDWPSSMRGIAKLQQADIQFKAGQRDKAVQSLKELKDDAKADTALRDMAALRLHMQTGELSFGGADAEGKPFAVLAGQMKAAQLLEEGRTKEAAVLLKTVIAATPPFSAERERANELLQLSGEGESK